MKDYKKKKCKICGKDYKPVSGNQEYCLDCRTKHRKTQSKRLRKRYYQEHREKEKAFRREYYKGNKEKLRKWREKYNKTLRGKYYPYRADARKRDMEWNLTISEFEKIAIKSCHYCGERDGKFSGVDRVDSSKGYTKDNCVPCCRVCNHMKWIMNPKEFLERCKKVVEYYK